jgi:ubiquinone/menaquinone biosynthesis C-methylase UbiE
MEHAAAGSSPFDAIAPAYDAEFTATLLGTWLRGAVREQLAALFAPGDHVIELGCGTGDDAVWLARRGVRVTATDASEAMLDVARRKAIAAGVASRIELCRVDLRDANFWVPARAFDGVLSNFGALNCLPDRRPVAGMLAQCVRPGGRVVVVVMGPVCPWEIAWHLFHGQGKTALRRFHDGVPAHAGGGAHLPVWYPSPRTVRREFAPSFQHVTTLGIGVLLPPTYLHHLVDRRPALFARLAAWERRRRARLPWTWLNDHYLLVLERRGYAR